MSEDEVKETHSLSYEFEKKPCKVKNVVSYGGYRQVMRNPNRINALDIVPLVDPNQFHSRVMYEEEEPEVSKLQKVRSSFQSVERFSGRLGAAFAKKSPQIGILDNSKRKTKITGKKRTKKLFGL